MFQRAAAFFRAGDGGRPLPRARPRAAPAHRLRRPAQLLQRRPLPRRACSAATRWAPTPSTPASSTSASSSAPPSSPTPTWPPAGRPASPIRPVRVARPCPPRTLSEADSKRLLAALRRPLRPGDRRRRRAAAVAAATSSASRWWPSSAATPSPTRPSGAWSGSTSADADAVADRGHRAARRRHAPRTATVGVLVAPMVTGNRELIAGLDRDPQFGLTVMVGVGGILAEAIADVAIRLVPITAVDAAEMIDDLPHPGAARRVPRRAGRRPRRARRRAARPVRRRRGRPDDRAPPTSTR